MLPLLLSLFLETRIYHPVPLDKISSTKWTHVLTEGTVTLVKKEGDGDWHIRLSKDEVFVVAEIIPKLSMNPPKVGQCIAVWGISRVDKTHGWGEIHPVEGWQPCQK